MRLWQKTLLTKSITLHKSLTIYRQKSEWNLVIFDGLALNWYIRSHFRMKPFNDMNLNINSKQLKFPVDTSDFKLYLYLCTGGVLLWKCRLFAVLQGVSIMQQFRHYAYCVRSCLVARCGCSMHHVGSWTCSRTWKGIKQIISNWNCMWSIALKMSQSWLVFIKCVAYI